MLKLCFVKMSRSTSIVFCFLRRTKPQNVLLETMHLNNKNVKIDKKKFLRILCGVGFFPKWLEPKNTHAYVHVYIALIPFLALPYKEFHAPMPNVKRRKNDSEFDTSNANASFISIMPLPSIFISKACVQRYRTCILWF